ncbi:DUF1653 domain-containing protein [Alicyclobacillus acidoterrestris]|uniref:DUF1653 domain-containing protein n=2 Tax=Alicyclobacillus TaxID=29330 RepID=T0BK57_ALIAG|nr:DUF1653 domain-containing protein [Alicyclobacillus acidoterrestris]EPZ40955.1 hypothetical protein N007_17665 [Alicyclobacillus acidoterrestris ATCC 49025]UNO49720.1 DUF1653 domain-containing protein [Alicyclobacillus acidoterrestris]
MSPEERMSTLRPGQIFRHYKGGLYTYHAIGRHSETEEWYVVYATKTGDIWIRPYDMFFETVEVDGQVVPRFQPLADA